MEKEKSGFHKFKELVERRLLKDEFEKSSRRCIRLLLKQDVSREEYKEILGNLKSFDSITDVFEVESDYLDEDFILDDKVIKEEVEYLKITSIKVP